MLACNFNQSLVFGQCKAYLVTLDHLLDYDLLRMKRLVEFVCFCQVVGANEVLRFYAVRCFWLQHISIAICVAEEIMEYSPVQKYISNLKIQ